jgi:hypothetical protein
VNYVSVAANFTIQSASVRGTGNVTVGIVGLFLNIDECI